VGDPSCVCDWMKSGFGIAPETIKNVGTPPHFLSSLVGHDLVQLALRDAQRTQHMVVGSNAISVAMRGRNFQKNVLLLGSREGLLFQENASCDAGLCLDNTG